MSFEQGKIYVMMGANGAGKSTLFNLITGFLKPKAGSILLKKEKINGLLPYLINRKGIGRTFQDLRLINKLSVLENIALAMKNNPTDAWYRNIVPGHKNYRRGAKVVAERIATAYHLDEVLNSMAGEISYGQQKLLTIACCVANDADMLLLDEPVAGVSPVYREHIAEALKQLRTKGKTILLVEHNTEFIEAIAGHILFLAEGKMHSFENMEALKNSAVLKGAYM